MPESIQVLAKQAQMMRLCVELLLHTYTLFGQKLVWVLSTHVDLEVKQQKCITEEEVGNKKRQRKQNGVCWSKTNEEMQFMLCCSTSSQFAAG